jgi:Holliday junction resolvase RusA-like endonuclease
MSYRSFIVNCKPVGKARARTVTKGGRTWSYTPKQTVDYEGLIRDAYSSQGDDTDGPWDGPVKLVVRVCGDQTEVHLFKLDPKKYVCTRPDADNIIKSICDALNGLAFKDDRQIADIEFERKKVLDK